MSPATSPHDECPDCKHQMQFHHEPSGCQWVVDYSGDRPPPCGCQTPSGRPAQLTVKGLIDLLSDCDPDALVVMEGCDCTTTARAVDTNEFDSLVLIAHQGWA